METITNKPKLIILSDLWGKEKSHWVKYYTQILAPHFEIQYYDVCVLGGVDKSDYTAESLHAQFVNGGVLRACTTLSAQESGNISVLGFSVGGTIAWKAALQGLKVQNLYAISSTRLRYETEKPNIGIHLFYGIEDPYQPNEEWCKKMEISPYFLKGQPHDFYQSPHFAKILCHQILLQKQ